MRARTPSLRVRRDESPVGGPQVVDPEIVMTPMRPLTKPLLRKGPKRAFTPGGRAVERLSPRVREAAITSRVISGLTVEERLGTARGDERQSVLRTVLSTAPARARRGGVAGATIARSGRETPAVRGDARGWAPAPRPFAVERADEYLRPHAPRTVLPPRARTVAAAEAATTEKAAAARAAVFSKEEVPGPGAYDPRFEYVRLHPFGENSVLPLARPTYGGGATEGAGAHNLMTELAARAASTPGPGAYKVERAEALISPRPPTVTPFSSARSGLGTEESSRATWVLGGRRAGDVLGGSGPGLGAMKDGALARANPLRGGEIRWRRGPRFGTPGKGHVWDAGVMPVGQNSDGTMGRKLSKHVDTVIAQYRASLRPALGADDDLLRDETGEKEEEKDEDGGARSRSARRREARRREIAERKERQEKRARESMSLSTRLEHAQEKRKRLEEMRLKKAQELLRTDLRRVRVRAAKRWLVAIANVNRALQIHETLQAGRASRLGGMMRQALGFTKERVFEAWKQWLRRRKLFWASIVFRTKLRPAVHAFRERSRNRRADILIWFCRAAQEMDTWKRLCRRYYARALRAQRFLHDIPAVLRAQHELLKLQWSRAVIVHRVQAVKQRISWESDRSTAQAAIERAGHRGRQTSIAERRKLGGDGVTSSLVEAWLREYNNKDTTTSTPSSTTNNAPRPARTRRLSIEAQVAMQAAAKAAQQARSAIVPSLELDLLHQLEDRGPRPSRTEHHIFRNQDGQWSKFLASEADVKPAERRGSYGDGASVSAAAFAETLAGPLRAGPTERQIARDLTNDIASKASGDGAAAAVARSMLPRGANPSRPGVLAIDELRDDPDRNEDDDNSSFAIPVSRPRRRTTRRMSVELQAVQSDAMIQVPPVDPDIRDAAIRRLLRAQRQMHARNMQLFRETVQLWDARLEEELLRAEHAVLVARTRPGAAWEGQRRTRLPEDERNALRTYMARARPKPPVWTPLPAFEDMLALVDFCVALQRQRIQERQGPSNSSKPEIIYSSDSGSDTE